MTSLATEQSPAQPNFVPRPLIAANKASLVTSALAVLLAAALVFAVVNFLQNRGRPPPPIDMSSRMADCRTEIRGSIDPKQLSPTLWNQLSDICYMQVRGEALLADFNIRRSNLIEQQVEGRIVLWMVVAITLSGVALAGLQLLAAYKLAGAGHGDLETPQEITLEQNKISLKSSVTGLMILVVSFAFFMVYVAWVYTAKELQQETPESASVMAATPAAAMAPMIALLPGGGGYGAPVTTAQSGYGPPPAGPASAAGSATPNGSK
jgi:hypothetical protein